MDKSDNYDNKVSAKCTRFSQQTEILLLTILFVRFSLENYGIQLIENSMYIYVNCSTKT